MEFRAGIFTGAWPSKTIALALTTVYVVPVCRLAWKSMFTMTLHGKTHVTLVLQMLVFSVTDGSSRDAGIASKAVMHLCVLDLHLIPNASLTTGSPIRMHICGTWPC